MSEKRVNISAQDFRYAPTEMKSYEPGEQVTRDNFTSMLIKGFYVSRGVFFRQEAFFRWIQSHSGFDYESTFNNFFSAGGWDCLSDTEQKVFEDIFYRIEPHTKEGATLLFERNPNAELKNNLPQFYYSGNGRGEKADMEKDMLKFKNSYGDFVSMDFHSFMANLNKFRKK